MHTPIAIMDARRTDIPTFDLQPELSSVAPGSLTATCEDLTFKIKLAVACFTPLNCCKEIGSVECILLQNRWDNMAKKPIDFKGEKVSHFPITY